MRPLKCVVMSVEQFDSAAASIAEALSREQDLGVGISLGEPSAGYPVCDLLLPIVDQDHLLAWRDLVTQVVHANESIVMPIAVGLDRQQLHELLSCGIHDFGTLPLNEAELRTRARRALCRALSDIDGTQTDTLALNGRGLIGRSPAFLKQLEMLPRMAGSIANVLILGETGTGKEIFARAIHYLSARAAKPWVAVNCGAIPADLLESELFGHVRGAFTNAHASRAGLVSEANGGTLFLDEIDSLPCGAQAKLLRFMQDFEYRAVGSDKHCKADVRVIAASNHDLAKAVERGDFRRDLFYRLNVFTISLPPLRERSDDIPALAAHFLAGFADRVGGRAMSLRPQALQRLIEHDWPGNVRELEHVLERAALMADGLSIGVSDLDLPARAAGGPAEESFRATKCRFVRTFERGYIERLLTSCEGNINLAARMAKKNRRALFALIRKHGICPEHYRVQPDTSQL